MKKILRGVADEIQNLSEKSGRYCFAVLRWCDMQKIYLHLLDDVVALLDITALVP